MPKRMIRMHVVNVSSVKVVSLIIGMMVASVSLYSTNAMAQAGGDKVEYEKNTIIDLTGGIIEGELTRPEGSYTVVRKLSKFSNLIRARTSYAPELSATHNDI